MVQNKAVVKFNPKPYMELAIEEMEKSLNEPRSDGKVPPKVGAIVLFPNGDIIRAHRGELRDGDHAEFTLLERKLGDTKLDDCILFTTLEPCVERTPPKIACCKRTSNARIKTVYVGISDPDPTVSGKGIQHLIDSKVTVTMFDRDLQQVIENENLTFLKQAKERRKKAEEQAKKTPLEKTILGSDVNSLSEEALQKFIFESKLDYKLDSDDFRQYLTDIGVLEFVEKESKYIPTGYGILLFGKNPRAKYSGAVLKAHVDYGNNSIEPKDFDQPLVLIPDLVEEWLKKVLPLSKDTTSFKRQDIPDFPIPILREAVVNALVHRNYQLLEPKSFLEIDNDKIVIKSPGAPHPSISIDQLQKFKAPSISPNPIISYVFNLMDYTEEKGFGMKTFKLINENHGLPLPEYIYEEPFLTLSFARNLEAVKKVSSHKKLSELNNEELRGYEFIKSKGEISRIDYEKQFDFKRQKALRHLRKLTNLGLIEGNGENPNSPNFRYLIR